MNYKVSRGHNLWGGKEDRRMVGQVGEPQDPLIRDCIIIVDRVGGRGVGRALSWIGEGELIKRAHERGPTAIRRNASRLQLGTPWNTRSRCIVDIWDSRGLPSSTWNKSNAF